MGVLCYFDIKQWLAAREEFAFLSVLWA